MDDNFVAEVDSYLAAFSRLWDDKKAPSDALLGRTRRLLNASERLVTPPTEETQRKLDALYGYFVLGRVMLTVALVNPVYIGYERRSLRKHQKEPATWSDVPC